MADFTLETGGFKATTVWVRPNNDAARERLGLGKFAVAAQYRKSDGFELADQLIAEGFKVSSH